jgi:phosphoglycerate dehydrogenase-like enzyme
MSAMSPPRPAIMLAMLRGMVDYWFTDEQLQRLDRAGCVLDREPVDDFGDPRAATLLAEAEVLVGHWGCPTLTAEVLAQAPGLRLLAYGGGTVKWQLTDAVWERDLVVTTAAPANAIPVAEYTLAMILLAGKGAFLFHEHQRDPKAVVPLDAMTAGNLHKRIGIVGASLVGRAVIELLRPFDVSVSVYDPYLDRDGAAVLGVELVEDLDELCASVDVLSLHAPDIPPTRGMIGARQVARLRDGAVLINTARPALVDQDALLAELRRGRIAAILDVTEPEPLPPEHALLALPNVFVTPHIAGSLGPEVTRMSELAVQEVERYARGEPPLHPVRRTDIDRIA